MPILQIRIVVIRLGSPGHHNRWCLFQSHLSSNYGLVVQVLIHAVDNSQIRHSVVLCLRLFLTQTMVLIYANTHDSGLWWSGRNLSNTTADVSLPRAITASGWSRLRTAGGSCCLHKPRMLDDDVLFTTRKCEHLGQTTYAPGLWWYGRRSPTDKSRNGRSLNLPDSASARTGGQVD